MTTILPISTINTNTEIDTLVDEYFFLDRYLGETLTLPYNFQEIKIKANDKATSADVINGALWKLYFNFLYLNKNTKLVTNDFPKTYKGFIGLTTNLFTSAFNPLLWNSGVSSINSGISNILSAAADCQVIQNNVDKSKYTIFISNPNWLVAYESDIQDTTITQTYSSSNITSSSNQTYSNISSLAINSEKDLFVLDRGNKLLIKYNTDSLITKNVALTGNLFVDNVIGGSTDDKYEKLRFVDPVTIDCCAGDLVYLYDNGSLGFKIYDKNLNWIETSIKTKDLKNKIVVDIVVDRIDTGNVFVLTEDGVLFVYKPLVKELISKTELNDNRITGEVYKKIVFSEINNDVLYVLTNKNIIKKFKSHIEDSIGSFRLDNAGIDSGDEFRFINLMRTDDNNFDYVFVGAQQGSLQTSISGKIFKFNEDTKPNTSINDLYKYEANTFERIQCKSDEFVTPFSFNKAFHKLVFNHLLMKDNIRYKFTAEYNSLGKILHTGYNSIGVSETNLYNYQPPQAMFIGINEPVLAETINRCLYQLYSLQETLLAMSIEKYSNVYPYSTLTVEI